METLPAHPPGPVADKLRIWPLDSGQYGLDATFQGRTGFERMEMHEAALKSAGFCSLGAARRAGHRKTRPQSQIQRTIILVMST
jgi:hypothetical protein